MDQTIRAILALVTVLAYFECSASACGLRPRKDGNPTVQSGSARNGPEQQLPKTAVAWEGYRAGGRVSLLGNSLIGCPPVGTTTVGQERGNRTRNVSRIVLVNVNHGTLIVGISRSARSEGEQEINARVATLYHLPLDQVQRVSVTQAPKSPRWMGGSDVQYDRPAYVILLTSRGNQKSFTEYEDSFFEPTRQDPDGFNTSAKWKVTRADIYVGCTRREAEALAAGIRWLIAHPNGK
jgi:hypothetical protein